MKKILTLYIVMLCAACGQTTKKSGNGHIDVPEKMTDTQAEQALTLMELRCNLCHGAAANHDARIAPPMVAVKGHYLEKYANRTDFIEAIVDFTKDPSNDASLMPGAVKRFGVMPYQVFDPEELRQIAGLIHDYKIREPQWFREHWKEKGFAMDYNKGKPLPNDSLNTARDYGKLGTQYALNTKKVLGKNLMGTIQRKGTVAALEFCNVRAVALTDSMATVHGVHIRRVSDKPRNADNQASPKELSYIASFKNELATGATPTPIVVDEGNHVQYYAPIITNDMCLQCHGASHKDVALDVLKTLAERYPQDRATGYDVNQVRGIWSIGIPKEKE